MKHLAALVAVVAGACSADRPNTHQTDGGVTTEMLAAPTLDPGIPAATPNATVAIRGSTAGARIVVKGGPGDPVMQPALPMGGFCLDVPLNAGANNLVAFALKDGLISPPTQITVTRDPAAPIPASPMCGGMEMPTCVEESPRKGNCANGIDDDCNGYTDQCDPNCNGCVDDALEPNNTPFFVPMIAAGTYNLSLCPCRVDWFAFNVKKGAVVHVQETSPDDPGKIDIDLLLQTPMDAEMNTNNYVAISAGVGNPETINWTATADGIYYLKVYPFSGSTANYTLTVY